MRGRGRGRPIATQQSRSEWLQRVGELLAGVPGNQERAVHGGVCPFEEARAYERLAHGCGIDADLVAKALGCSRAHLFSRRKLLKLAPELRHEVIAGRLDATLATNIARIRPPAMQIKCVRELGERFPGGYSFREAIDFARAQFGDEALGRARSALLVVLEQRIGHLKAAARSQVEAERAAAKARAREARDQAERQRLEARDSKLTQRLERLEAEERARAETKRAAAEARARVQLSEGQGERLSAAATVDPTPRKGVHISSSGARVYINVDPPGRSGSHKQRK